MSLILDALRKSEAERRRGQAPSLYAAMPVPGTRARPEWLRFLPLVAVAVLVAVALFAFRGNDAPATKEELQAESNKPSPVPAPARDDAGVDADAATTALAPPPTTPAPPVAPSPSTLSPSKSSGAAPLPSVDALVKPPATAPVATAPAPTPAIAAPPPAAEAAAPADEAAPEDLPPIAVLDAGTRSSLPAMKLSMHVYNSDPSRRFAIIDDQRVTEGSQLGSATVVEIRRDGVVLDVGGRRVLLPRP